MSRSEGSPIVCSHRFSLAKFIMRVFVPLHLLSIRDALFDSRKPKTADPKLVGSESTANLPKQFVGVYPPRQYVGVQPPPQNGDTLTNEESEAIEDIKKIPGKCAKDFAGLHLQIGQGLQFPTSIAAKAFALKYVSNEIAKIKDISLTHHRTAKEARLASVALKLELEKVLRLIDGAGEKRSADPNIGGSEEVEPAPQNGDTLTNEESKAIEVIKKIPGKCAKDFAGLHLQIGQGLQFPTSIAAKNFALKYVSNEIAKIKDISLTHHRTAKEAKLASVALKLELMNVFRFIDGAGEKRSADPNIGGSESTAKLPRRSVEVQPPPQNGDTLTEEEAIEHIKAIPKKCVIVLANLDRRFGKGKEYQTSADAKAFALRYVSKQIAKIKDISQTHRRTEKEARIASVALKLELKQVLRLIDAAGKK